jgi:hypothetical protein
LTWAFCGLGRAGAEPTALVVFTADAPPVRLAIATHFHDLAVALSAPLPAAALAPEAWTVLCPAVLGALRPATRAALTRLLPHLEPALSVLAGAGEGPADPVLTVTGETEASLTGPEVPDYLLLRAGTVWRCRHVARARLTFGAEPRTVLDLAPAWGEPARSPTDAALLVRSGAVSVARVAP